MVIFEHQSMRDLIKVFRSRKNILYVYSISNCVDTIMSKFKYKYHNNAYGPMFQSTIKYFCPTSIIIPHSMRTFIDTNRTNQTRNKYPRAIQRGPFLLLARTESKCILFARAVDVFWLINTALMWRCSVQRQLQTPSLLPTR